MIVQYSITDDSLRCADCRCNVGMAQKIKFKAYERIRCAKCHLTYNDNLYLDEGSEAMIKERIDRDEEVHANYFEQERELDELLETY